MLLPFVRELFADVEMLPAFTRVASHLREGTGRIRVSGLSPTAKALLLVLLLSGGRPAIVIEHITRLRPDLRPDWAQPAQPGGSYRVEITGEPSYVVDICPTSRKGDHNYAAILAAAGRIVNAIPAVVAAEPGIRTTLDLPLVTGQGLYVNG